MSTFLYLFTSDYLDNKAYTSSRPSRLWRCGTVYIIELWYETNVSENLALSIFRVTLEFSPPWKPQI